jgi:hypothetical protein
MEAQKMENYPLLRTSSVLTWRNRLDHWLARWRIRRTKHRVEPGLYELGHPTSGSPVFITANYTLSFDALRSALGGIDGYILVLDTQGVNVWCAAGKGTFGTDELVARLEAVGLQNITNRRKLILPQLGATGVSAHEIKKRSGFTVEYGPVRAVDLPEYLESRRATAEMRRVRFNLWDRLMVVPVEIIGSLLYLIAGAAIAYLAGGWLSVLATITAILAGAALFPILLPWIPAKDFSRKGFILGGVVILPFVLELFLGLPGRPLWSQILTALSYFLIFPSITAFLALNFTGSTTFTSKSGVRREIFKYVPIMAWMFGGGIVLTIVLKIIHVFSAGGRL